MLPAYVGVTAPVFASVPKATLGRPLACSGVAGMAALWHSLQATCFEKLGPPAAPVSRCFTWAPTLAPVEAFDASTGGADEKATQVGVAAGPGRVTVAGGAGLGGVLDRAVHVGRDVDRRAGVAGVAGAAVGPVRVEPARRRRRRRHAVAGVAHQRRRGLPGRRHVGRADPAAQVAVAVGVGAGAARAGVGRRGDAARGGQVREDDRAGRHHARLVDLRRHVGVAGVAEHRTRTRPEHVRGVHADAVEGDGGVAVGVRSADARGRRARRSCPGCPIATSVLLPWQDVQVERRGVDGAVHVQATGDEHRAGRVHRRRRGS